MAMSESHILGNTIIRFEAHGVLSPQAQSQVLVRIRFTDVEYCLANTLSILQATVHRFHLGQIPLLRAVPTIISFVLARIDGIHETIWRLCNNLLHRFSAQVAAQMMDGSALELLVHIGLLLRPGGSNQGIELMTEWMLENLPEEEEEMAGDVYDYYLYEGVDIGHGGFPGVPASRSFVEGLQRLLYGRGDGVREEECVICLMEFDAQAEVSKMPCSHAFHSRCIIQWLETSHVCPICRSQMPTDCSN
ncbi:E3 ubiquitin-protein ligase RNF181-like [Cocos nucifera]|uniref:E3 ubiquitin-protein ligase RNF181-like n=1 Tax=Cocos nucifera TaxID=13894 RepID=A0A8K0MVE5_COCNU|nr:E3 ubiquitin-protein ligase RNF181-like [Cocos nucifera]